ncbi:MAG: DUF4861 domain-containing protein [Cytophagaceae bacterium]|nr:DUF4861 domain-containing protein [Cytophagaceae bacterium]
MKRLNLLLFFLFPVSLFSQSVKIRLENPSPFSRKDEPVIITKEFLSTIGEITAEKIIKVSDADKNIIPSQCDDLNGDGAWDEVALVYNFDEYETTDLIFELIHKDSLPAFEKRTHGRLAVSREKNNVFTPLQTEIRPADHLPQSRPMLYQYEGAGWENDMVAFRSYFDSRNGKDIFGKKERTLVLDTIGLPGGDYHIMASWGLDILKVGNSLGAGALALYENGKLVRLGQTDKAVFELIADGPVRTIVRLKYEGWNVNGKTLNLQEDITIWAGKYWYQSKVSISGIENGELVTGIVNLKNKQKQKTAIKLNPPYRCLLTYARQSEINDYLGMGILFPSSEFIAFGEASADTPAEEIGNTFYVRLKVSAAQPAVFYFFACWEQADEKFKTQQGVIKEIEKEADNLYTPVRVTIR